MILQYSVKKHSKEHDNIDKMEKHESSNHQPSGNAKVARVYSCVSKLKNVKIYTSKLSVFFFFGDWIVIGPVHQEDPRG